MIVAAPKTIEALLIENQRLLALVKQQEITIGSQSGTIQALHHQLSLMRQAKFGRKSEKYIVPEQLSLQFDEAETTEITCELLEPVISEDNTAPQVETITYTRNKKNTGRKPLPKNMPYVEQIHDLPESEKQCACGCALTHIKDEITEQLDIIPQMTFKVIHIRKKYACKSCEETIRIADCPKQPIKKSIAAPGLLAMVIDSKFNRHMPLFRQEAMFAEAGLSLTRGTLGNWVIHCANLLEPLVKLMTSDIQEYDIAFADETPVQVLKEKDRLPNQKSTMWLFSGGPPSKRAFIYQYHKTRSQEVAFEFFEDFKGYVHADCYKAYINLGQKPSVHHVACWAHARRYFADIVKLNKKKGIAHEVVSKIAKLYELEKKLKEQNATPQQIFIQRLIVARPILKSLYALLTQVQSKTLPKSPLGKAISYTLNHWDALNVYCYDGRLEIDNNRSERAIKPFVIGRKNWLFHDSEQGAHAGSILYSLIETCKQHHIDVFAWLKYALTHIHQAHTIEQLEALLPYQCTPHMIADMRTMPGIKFPG
jgi:transposase